MSGKDFLKIVMCFYRYDKDIDIDVWRNDMEGVVYDVTATNSRTGDGYHGVSYGPVDAVYDFLSYVENLKEHWTDLVFVENLDYDGEDNNYVNEPPSISNDWVRYTMKHILDDNFREETIKQWNKDEQERSEFNEFFKDIDEWEKSSMPCRNGTCAEREWTDMSCVDHCVKNWRMSCPKLRQWHEDVKTKRTERMKEWKEHKYKLNNESNG